MPTQKLTLALACFTIIGVVGCEAPGGDYGYGGYGHTPSSSGVVQGAPLFSTDMAEYGRNQHITLSLNNRTRAVMDYNLCRSIIERFDGGWRPVQPVSETCTAELRRLAPGQSTTFSFEFPPTLDLGQYRVRTSIGGRGVLYTNSFTVMRRRGSSDS